MSNRKTSILVFTLIFVCVLFGYWINLRDTFILDDYVWIQSLNWSQIQHLFVGSWEHGNTLRPIMRLQFWSSRLLFGENPLGWHLVNLFLHSLVAWCAYVIVEKTTRNKILGIISALVFALFPTNHEVVAWMSGRTHSFGFLLALLSGFLIYRGNTVSRRYGWYLTGGFVVLLCAFLTYEVSFAVPLALLAILLLIGPRSRRAMVSVVGSFGMLGGLVMYRWFVLGGSIGSVGAQYDNLLLAPFLNFHQFAILYWHSRELKYSLLLLVIILVLSFVKQKKWREYSTHSFRLILLSFIFSILAYAPFVITKGVAPRFLYSSLFFCFVTLALLYDFLKDQISKWVKMVIFILVAMVLVLCFWQTRTMAGYYHEVAGGYAKIRQTVKNDYPVWPKEKVMLFYGIPNGHHGVLAFLTYFEMSIHYAYPEQNVGKVYRADRLTADELNAVLKSGPIIYDFLGFDKGVVRR